MVTERACLGEDYCSSLLLWIQWFFYFPIVNLDAPFTVVEANGIRVLQYDKLLLEAASSVGLAHQISSILLIIIFIPVEIDTLGAQLLEFI